MGQPDKELLRRGWVGKTHNGWPPGQGIASNTPNCFLAQKQKISIVSSESFGTSEP